MILQEVLNPLPNKGGESISISSRFLDTSHEKKEGKK